MTLNNLIQNISEEHRNKIIKIYIPNALEDDEKGKDHPLIEINVDKNAIILTPDCGW